MAIIKNQAYPLHTRQAANTQAKDFHVIPQNLHGYYSRHLFDSQTIDLPWHKTKQETVKSKWCSSLPYIYLLWWCKVLSILTLIR